MSDAPTDFPSAQVEPSVTIPSAKEGDVFNPQAARFRELIRRFVSDSDDAIGHLAFSLFAIETLDRDGNQNAQAVFDRMEAVDLDVISKIYFAAANRLATIHFESLAKKQLDKEVRKEQLYILLSQHADLKYEGVTQQIDHSFSQIKSEIASLTITQTPIRQIVANAFATALVVILASTIVFGTDLLASIKSIWGK